MDQRRQLLDLALQLPDLALQTRIAPQQGLATGALRIRGVFFHLLFASAASDTTSTDKCLQPKGSPTIKNRMPRHRLRDLIALPTRERVLEKDQDGYFVASVPALPGCHTQARSLDELMERVKEAVALCLEVEGAPPKALDFVGVQRIRVA